MNDPIVILLVSGLATFRIVYLVYNDVGPFEIFDRLRDWSGSYAYRDYIHQIMENAQLIPNYTLHSENIPQFSFFARLLSCPFCLGIWIAPFVLLMTMYGGLLFWLMLYFAACGLAAIPFLFYEE